jgi:hypothetical protein
LVRGGIDERFTKALIVLLPKEEGDIRDPSKLRPISLLNTDYRLYMRVLAERLKPRLKEMIHPDQTGFVPKRFIIDNVATVKIFSENLRGRNIITFLDCTKAFDRVGPTTSGKSWRLTTSQPNS